MSRLQNSTASGMGSRYLIRSLAAQIVAIYNADLQRIGASVTFASVEKRLEAFLSQAKKIASSNAGTGEYYPDFIPILCLRRVWREIGATPLPCGSVRFTVRSGDLRIRSVAGKKPRLHKNQPAKPGSCRLCGQVHNEGTDRAVEVLGLSCARVRGYELAARDRAWRYAADRQHTEIAQRKANEILWALWPFGRKYMERQDAWRSRLREIRRQDIPIKALSPKSDL